METHNFNFQLNRLSKIFLIRQPEIMYDGVISSFSISLFYSRMHPLSFLSPFLYNYILGSVANPLQQLLTIPSVCCYLCPPFLKITAFFCINFDFCFEKRLFLKYFKNNFKIFLKYLLNVIVLYILRISLCVFYCIVFICHLS